MEVLVKPFSIDAFAARARAIIGRRSSGQR
jgi:DNA-binding response OmpR family regulator